MPCRVSVDRPRLAYPFHIPSHRGGVAVKEAILDVAYFALLMFLILYGLLLVLRGYLGLVLSGYLSSPRPRVCVTAQSWLLSRSSLARDSPVRPLTFHRVEREEKRLGYDLSHSLGVRGTLGTIGTVLRDTVQKWGKGRPKPPCSAPEP